MTDFGAKDYEHKLAQALTEIIEEEQLRDRELLSLFLIDESSKMNMLALVVNDGELDTLTHAFLVTLADHLGRNVPEVIIRTLTDLILAMPNVPDDGHTSGFSRN